MSVYSAIQELALLGESESWSLLADTDPEEFLRAVRREIEHLRTALKEAEDMILDLTCQGCHHAEDGTIDSCALSAYADSLVWLAERGRVVIVSEAGRRVIARIR